MHSKFSNSLSLLFSIISLVTAVQASAIGPTDIPLEEFSARVNVLPATFPMSGEVKDAIDQWARYRNYCLIACGTVVLCELISSATCKDSHVMTALNTATYTLAAAGTIVVELLGRQDVYIRALHFKRSDLKLLKWLPFIELRPWFKLLRLDVGQTIFRELPKHVKDGVVEGEVEIFKYLYYLNERGLAFWSANEREKIRNDPSEFADLEQQIIEHVHHLRRQGLLDYRSRLDSYKSLAVEIDRLVQYRRVRSAPSAEISGLVNDQADDEKKAE